MSLSSVYQSFAAETSAAFFITGIEPQFCTQNLTDAAELAAQTTCQFRPIFYESSSFPSTLACSAPPLLGRLQKSLGEPSKCRVCGLESAVVVEPLCHFRALIVGIPSSKNGELLVQVLHFFHRGTASRLVTFNSSEPACTCERSLHMCMTIMHQPKHRYNSTLACLHTARHWMCAVDQDPSAMLFCSPLRSYIATKQEIDRASGKHIKETYSERCRTQFLLAMSMKRHHNSARRLSVVEW